MRTQKLAEERAEERQVILNEMEETIRRMKSTGKEINITFNKLFQSLEEITGGLYRVHRGDTNVPFPETYRAASPTALAKWLVSCASYQFAGQTFRIIDSSCGNEHRYVVVLDIDTGEYQASLETG